MAADRLDDPDYPAYTTGRAAAALGVQQAFLRALDAAGAVTPQRSAGGHRRYTRRQLAFAGRIRELFDQGHSLTSALRILGLQDDVAGLQDDVAGLQGDVAGLQGDVAGLQNDLAAERARTASLQRQLHRQHGHSHGPPAEGNSEG